MNQYVRLAVSRRPTPVLVYDVVAIAQTDLKCYKKTLSDYSSHTLTDQRKTHIDQNTKLTLSTQVRRHIHHSSVKRLNESEFFVVGY